MNNTHVQPLLVDESVASEFLGISARTLFSQRKAGRIPFLRIGRRVKYDLDVLRQWARSQQQQDRIQDSAR